MVHSSQNQPTPESDAAEGNAAAGNQASAYSSPLIDHVAKAVAVAADDIGGRTGVAWHYGDPLVEQRRMMDNCGIVDRSYRKVIRIGGPDRLTWLNTLLSQKLADGEAGKATTSSLVNVATEALNLDAQGRIQHHLNLTILPEYVLADVSPIGAEALFKYLSMMVFWSDVTIEWADLAVLSVVGPHTPEVLARAHWEGSDSLPFPEVHKAALIDETTPVAISHIPWPSGGRVDLLVPRDSSTQLYDALAEAGATPAGLMAFEAERVMSLHPEIGLDVDDKMIPHESQNYLTDAVHLEKGCYRGQETVARVHNLGKPPRTLVVAQLDGSAAELPEVGAPITAGRRTVGRIGTVADHFEYGPVALALVKRSAQQSNVSGQMALEAQGCAIMIDPDTVSTDDSIGAGRAAIMKLRGTTQ